MPKTAEQAEREKGLREYEQAPTHRISRWSGLAVEESPWCGATAATDRHHGKKTVFSDYVTCAGCLKKMGPPTDDER